MDGVRGRPGTSTSREVLSPPWPACSGCRAPRRRPALRGPLRGPLGGQSAVAVFCLASALGSWRCPDEAARAGCLRTADALLSLGSGAKPELRVPAGAPRALLSPGSGAPGALGPPSLMHPSLPSASILPWPSPPRGSHRSPGAVCLPPPQLTASSVPGRGLGVRPRTCRLGHSPNPTITYHCPVSHLKVLILLSLKMV